MDGHQRGNNVIDNGNGNFLSENHNVNDNDNNVFNNGNIGPGSNKYERSKLVDMTAYKLCEIFGHSPTDDKDENKPSIIFKFYCRVAWRLQPSVIWANVEMALKGNNPAALFTYLCKKCLGDR